MRSLRFVSLCVLVLLAVSLPMGGCAKTDAGGADAGSGREAPADPAAEPASEPEYTSWEVYINDDDSYEEGGITYSIALNFKATNPTRDIAGTYAGEATAKTSTSGQVGGQQLEASAIANSGRLEFTLTDPTAGGELGQLTENPPDYVGTGTITMEAAGSGTIGGASGGFSNTSSQPLTVEIKGNTATLEVPISGHTYTFTGVISGLSAGK